MNGRHIVVTGFVREQQHEERGRGGCSVAVVHSRGVVAGQTVIWPPLVAVGHCYALSGGSAILRAGALTGTIGLDTSATRARVDMLQGLV